MDFDHDELIALAQHDMAQGRLEGALAKLKRVVQADSAPIHSLAMTAKLYAQLGLFTRSKVLYERYLVTDAHSDEINFELGMIHFDSSDAGTALRIWSELLDRTPTYPPALFYSALALSGDGRLGEAKRHLDVLLHSAAEDNLYYGRGKDLLRSIEAEATQQSAAAALN